MSAVLESRRVSSARAELGAAQQAEFQSVMLRVLGPQWNDTLWRLRNLYWIVDEDGARVRFVPNEEQEQFLSRWWYRNLILKARQLGFSTLMAIMELDQAIFNANYRGNIISDSLPNAGKLFRKVEYAYENLPAEIRKRIPLKGHTSRSEMVFDHALGESSVTVSVSARGDTLQLLHVSELGKIARKFPGRAEEIVTGSFPTVPQKGVIVVESTAEGAAGEFYDLVKPALDRMREGAPETMLDWRLHFFPWYLKKAYATTDEDTPKVHISDHFVRYFRELESKLGITLTAGQRAWYVVTHKTQKKKMKREYPSTPEEAFEAAIDGAIYGEEMTNVREFGRIGKLPIDPTYPVNTFWDLGSANTFIWLHQHVGHEHRFVKTFGGRKVLSAGMGKWWRTLETYRMEWAPDEKPFLWGRHYLPHDGDAQVQGDENETRKEILGKAGAHNIVIVPRVQALDDGIESLRAVLDINCWFDRDECAEGITALDCYQYEWDEQRGMFTDNPLHNWASHPCDALRQFSQGYSDTGDLKPSLAKLKTRKRSRY